MSDNMLSTAIKLGEAAVVKTIAMANRERKLKWKLYRVRYLLTHGRTHIAVDAVNDCIDYIKEGAREMTPGPPVTWVHALHQITGLFALRGNRIEAQEREQIKTILRTVLKEMENDEVWPRPRIGEP